MARPDSTCWTLVRGAANGHAGDRETFVARYAPVVRAYLSARWRVPGDHERINDGLQDVFLQCFKDGGALERVHADGQGGFRAFFYGIVRNVAFAHEGRGRPSREAPVEPPTLETVPADDATLSNVFDHAWARVVTREARWLMSERSRDDPRARQRFRALELRYQEGLPSRDIARRMGLDVGDVYQILLKARKEFRASLLEVMAGYHPNDSRAELEQRCVELLHSL